MLADRCIDDGVQDIDLLVEVQVGGPFEDPARALVGKIKEHDAVTLAKAANKAMPHGHRLLDAIKKNQRMLSRPINTVRDDEALYVEFTLGSRRYRRLCSTIQANSRLAGVSVSPHSALKFF